MSKYNMKVLNYRTGEYDIKIKNLNDDQVMIYSYLIDKDKFNVDGVKYGVDEVKFEKIKENA